MAYGSVAPENPLPPPISFVALTGFYGSLGLAPAILRERPVLVIDLVEAPFVVPPHISFVFPSVD